MTTHVPIVGQNYFKTIIQIKEDSMAVRKLIKYISDEDEAIATDTLLLCPSCRQEVSDVDILCPSCGIELLDPDDHSQI